MNRRMFVGNTFAGAMLSTSAGSQQGPVELVPSPALVVERVANGTPRAGKVLVAIQPHSDDIPIFAAGTVAKLLKEGCTGYLVRVTNDDMAGPGSIAATVRAELPALDVADDVELLRAVGQGLGP